MPDAIALLKADHAKVKKLLQQLEKAPGAKRRDGLLAKIVTEVAVHTRIEEEIFYPAFKEASRTKEDRKLYFEAQAEHGAVKTLMPKLQETDRGSDEFAGKAKVLKELIEHHAEEEEEELFPRVRSLLSKDVLQELGRRMKERKQALTRRPR